MSYQSRGMGPKHALKRMASPLLDGLGLYERGLKRLKHGSGTWTILMYHRVIADRSEDPFGLGMCVRLHHFAAQLRYLQRDFEPISLPDAVARLRRGEPLPPRALSITFDDGYLDNLELAYPLLKQHGMPWSLFIATGGLEQGEMLWWDRVIRAFALTGEGKLDTGVINLPLRQQQLPLDGAHRETSLQAVLGALWAMPIEAVMVCVAVMEKVLLRAGASGGPRATRMRPDQIRQLGQEGVEIAAHTVRHPNLTLLGPGEALRELQQSRRTVEAITGIPVIGFAYPGGRANAEVADAVVQAGFDYAVGTVSGINTGPYELLELTRVGMPDTGVADFKRALGKVVRRSFEPGAQLTTIHAPLY
ncbi:MAG: polysaccharide deacetylase family protein [Burkholderiales bacterium]